MSTLELFFAKKSSTIIAQAIGILRRSNMMSRFPQRTHDVTEFLHNILLPIRIRYKGRNTLRRLRISRCIRTFHTFRSSCPTQTPGIAFLLQFAETPETPPHLRATSLVVRFAGAIVREKLSFFVSRRFFTTSRKRTSSARVAATVATR